MLIYGETMITVIKSQFKTEQQLCIAVWHISICEPTSLHHLFQSAFRDNSWLTRRATDVTFFFLPAWVTAMDDVNQRDQSKLRRRPRTATDGLTHANSKFSCTELLGCRVLTLLLTFVAHCVVGLLFFRNCKLSLGPHTYYCTYSLRDALERCDVFQFVSLFH